MNKTPLRHVLLLMKNLPGIPEVYLTLSLSLIYTYIRKSACKAKPGENKPRKK